MRKLSPPQAIAVSFLSIILLGTILLSLPVATTAEGRLPFTDALFTATSATCVTGLIVRDTGTYFSLFGQIVILILMQLGGLGLMTFSTLFAILLGKKLTIKENVVIQTALDQHSIEGIPELLKMIVSITFAIELVGATVLFARWLPLFDQDILKTLYYSIFHSVSAFCNAGFSLFSTSLEGFRNDMTINIIFMALIILGGLGFIVLIDFPRLNPWRSNKTQIPSRVGLHTKVVLVASLTLIAVGMIFLFLFEYKNALAGAPLKEKILASSFQAVTPRTAGFSTMNIGQLMPQSHLLLMFLMIIGASPGGTGGGIKTVTFCVLLASFVAFFRNRDRISMFKRTLPKIIFRRAFLILSLAIGWLFIFTVAVCFIERVHWSDPNFFRNIMFEVISAFGTVGLSTGITQSLHWISKILLSMTMLFGRVGPLTLILAISLREERVMFTYPEERLMVG